MLGALCKVRPQAVASRFGAGGGVIASVEQYQRQSPPEILMRTVIWGILLKCVRTGTAGKRLSGASWHC